MQDDRQLTIGNYKLLRVCSFSAHECCAIDNVDSLAPVYVNGDVNRSPPRLTWIALLILLLDFALNCISALRCSIALQRPLILSPLDLPFSTASVRCIEQDEDADVDGDDLPVFQHLF